jgi:hypothetical protein
MYESPSVTATFDAEALLGEALASLVTSEQLAS